MYIYIHSIPVLGDDIHTLQHGFSVKPGASRKSLKPFISLECAIFLVKWFESYLCHIYEQSYQDVSQAGLKLL